MNAPWATLKLFRCEACVNTAHATPCGTGTEGKLRTSAAEGRILIRRQECKAQKGHLSSYASATWRSLPPVLVVRVANGAREMQGVSDGSVAVARAPHRTDRTAVCGKAWRRGPSVKYYWSTIVLANNVSQLAPLIQAHRAEQSEPGRDTPAKVHLVTFYRSLSDL